MATLDTVSLNDFDLSTDIGKQQAIQAIAGLLNTISAQANAAAGTVPLLGTANYGGLLSPVQKNELVSRAVTHLHKHDVADITGLSGVEGTGTVTGAESIGVAGVPILDPASDGVLIKFRTLRSPNGSVQLVVNDTDHTVEIESLATGGLPTPLSPLRVLQAYDPGTGLAYQQRFVSGGEEYVASNYLLGTGADQAAAFNSLLTTIGSAHATITFSANFQVTLTTPVATAIPTNVKLKFAPGSGIVFGAAGLLLHGDPIIEAGPYQVFYGVAGNFQFDNSFFGSWVQCNWFGASMTLSDNAPAFDFWIDACRGPSESGAPNLVSYKRPMMGTWGTYNVTREIVFPYGRNRVLAGPHPGIQFTPDHAGFCIQLQNAGTKTSPLRSVITFDANSHSYAEYVNALVGGAAAALYCFYLTIAAHDVTYGTSTQNMLHGCVAATAGPSNTSYVKYGFKIGSVEQPGLQVDLNYLSWCRSFGSWNTLTTAEIDAGWYDSGFYFGDGRFANCLNHQAIACVGSNWRWAVTTNATNTYVQGGTYDTNGSYRTADGRWGGLWHIISGLIGPSYLGHMRAEGCGCIVRNDSGNLGSVFMAEIDKLDFTGEGLGPEMFRWNTGGVLHFKQLVEVGLPTAPGITARRIVGQAGNMIVYENCTLDSVTLDQLAANSDIVETGSPNGGPTMVLGSYTQNSIGGIVKVWRGNFFLNSMSFVGGATPSAAGAEYIVLGNSAPVTVTDFVDGADGMERFVDLDANTTIQHNSNIHLSNGTDLVGTAGGGFVVHLKRLAGVWNEVGRVNRNTLTPDAVEAAVASVGSALISHVFDTRRGLYLPNSKPTAWTDYRRQTDAVSMNGHTDRITFNRANNRIVGAFNPVGDDYTLQGGVMNLTGTVAAGFGPNNVTIVFAGELLTGNSNGFWWEVSGAGGAEPKIYVQDNSDALLVVVIDTHGHTDTFWVPIPTRGPAMTVVSVKTGEATVKVGSNAAVVQPLTAALDAGVFKDLALGSGTGGSSQYADYEAAGLWLLNEYYNVPHVAAIAGAYSGYAS